MRAFTVQDFDTPPAFTQMPQPQPGPCMVRIHIAACGLNFADLLMQNGQYQDTPEPPFVLGMEVAGRIDALGPDVTGFAIGDRVAVFGGSGGLAEYGCFDADRVVAIPDGMGWAEAAAFQIAYGTSHLALDHRAGLKAGETLVVLGAAGGVGLTAVEIGAQMGAQVVAVARGTDRLRAAEAAGAHHLIDTETQDTRSAIKALGGADVVYDPVGGALFDAAFRACKPEARILTIGFASGTVPSIKANHLLVKNLTVMGLYWGGYLRFRPEALRTSLTTLMEWHGTGRIKPHIGARFAFDDAAEGLALLQSRKATGKIVIDIADP